MTLPLARLAAATTVAAALLWPARASAQTFTWNGGAGNGNWSSPTNWDTPPTPPGGSGVMIVLAGTTQTVTIQNLSAPPFVLNQLNMDNTATNGFSVSGSQLQFAGVTPQLINGSTAALSISAPIDFANTSTTINIVNNGAPTHDVILSGALTGSGTLTRSGNFSANLLINNANNSFNGTLSIQSGIVRLGAANALGRTTAIDTGGSNLNTLVNAIGVNNQGFALGGFAQALGNVTGTGTVQIGDATSSSAYLIGFRAGDFTFGGRFVAANTASHLAKVGTQTMTLTGNSTAFSGSTSVRDGTIAIQGAGTLTGASTGTVTIYNGGTFLLDNAAANNANRLTNTAPVALAGGTFRLTGNAAAATTETVGAMLARSGQSTVAVAPTAGQSTLLTFANGAGGLGTVFFQGPQLGQTLAAGVGNIQFTSTPTLVGGGGSGPATSILPWGFASTTNGATPDTLVTIGGNGVRPLDLATDYTTFAAAGAITDNVRETANVAIGLSTVQNGLVTAGANQTVTLNAPLQLTSGALLNTGNDTVLSGPGPLTLGTGGGNGRNYVTTTGSLTLAVPVFADNLVKSGLGTLNVQRPVTLGANGTVALNAGTLAISNAGATSGGFTTTSGTLTYRVAGGATLDVSGVAAGFTVAANQVLSGNGSVVGAVTIGNGGTIAPSALGGPGASLASPGTLTINNMAWLGGGTYEWSLNSATGGLYTQSSIAATSTLNISSLSAANQFTIRLISLQPDNSAGNVYDFDPSRPYDWTLGSFAGGIVNPAGGFSSSHFIVDTSQFSNMLPVGSMFSVVENGNLVVLHFEPTPEPAAILTITFLAGAVFHAVRRRRRGASPGIPASTPGDYAQS